VYPSQQPSSYKVTPVLGCIVGKVLVEVGKISSSRNNKITKTIVM
jgi:hypothetical protein